ncbi:Dabb family protein [Clostridium massiliamazoniense]|uniref:Dabb family protein n=1 Tax=Clostridium massiliamazoniense TaxID=1347366 RepID=UPI0006D7D7E3|nr:Dabb family protein [Clostridium massiliamazoniense]
MIKHIVMWKLKEENKENNAMKIKNDLEALKDKIAEVKVIEVGINFNESEAAYDVVLYSEFESKEDLDIYQNNKDHKEVGVFVRACTTDRKVVDYTV